MFQSTHPRGVRHSSRGGIWRQKRFQSTHPRGVRRPSSSSARPSWACFNPRTRVGCDGRGCRQPPPYGRVSIHAPAWGATLADLEHFRHGGSFNPRTRVGCDPRQRRRWYPLPGFNPRTRVGCDSRVCRYAVASGLFQSTHPRGVRPHAERIKQMFPERFNPRTRVGCDCRLLVSLPRRRMFQSTHPRGVRRGDTDGIRDRTSFNPRTRVGCDSTALPISWPRSRFNPRTRVGCDARQIACASCSGCFNPRTRVGCDTS